MGSESVYLLRVSTPRESFHAQKIGISLAPEIAKLLKCRISSVVEQRFCKPLVGSSNLSSGTTVMADRPRPNRPAEQGREPPLTSIRYFSPTFRGMTITLSTSLRNGADNSSRNILKVLLIRAAV